MSGASLYVIHQTLEELHELRQQVADDGDLEAAAAVDQQIAEWLDRSPEKVTSYVGLIRQRENTVAACKAERARIKVIEEQAEADIERLKGNALAAMQRFDIKELKATPGGGLRRQVNGGVEPLEIATGFSGLPNEYLVATVSMPMLTWAALKLGEREDTDLLNFRLNQDKIREALKQRVRCTLCNGSGIIDGQNCNYCKGEASLPATVPGAKLLPRGEHVRIFPKSTKEIE